MFLYMTITTIIITPVQAQEPPVISIIKVDDPDPVLAGANLTYTITYENIGNVTADNVTITKYYSSDVTFVSANPAPNVGTNNTWTIFNLAPDGSHQILITVEVTPSTPQTTLIQNYVVALVNGIIKPAYAAYQNTTITRIPLRGKIIVDKITIPSGSSQSFNFTTDAGLPFSLTDASTPWDSGLIDPGTYYV
jgi:uncharacterized repeat protein (TIGR01451 family)